MPRVYHKTTKCNFLQKDVSICPPGDEAQQTRIFFHDVTFLFEVLVDAGCKYEKRIHFVYIGEEILNTSKHSRPHQSHRGKE